MLDGSFTWHLTEKEIWFMDQIAFAEAFAPLQLRSNPVEIGADRGGIKVLTKETLKTAAMNPIFGHITVEELRAMLKAKLPVGHIDEIIELMPSIYINADNLCLKAFYYEAASFEDFVPVGWKGRRAQFWNELPPSKRYWEENDHLLFGLPSLESI